jgi:predicted phage baseplate assembly protein
VDEGDRVLNWQAVDDLYGSKPTDAHYVLNRTSGEIRFGDGFRGDVPTANVANPGGNIVAREYRFGGGQRGNVAANRLNTLITPVDGIDQSGQGGVTNLRPAVGGRNEETFEEARRRAPQALQNKGRAVSARDFEVLAQEVGTIKRAKALPLFHPDFPDPDVKVPGVVTVIVVPDTEATDPRPNNGGQAATARPAGRPDPRPSEGTLRTVCAYLNQRRLLTTELYVIAPTYRLVRIEADVVAANDADLGEVRTQIENTLLNYFHPLVGGEDGQGWPFGENIYYSRVYQRVFTVPGVDRIARLTIALDGEAGPECSDVPIPPGQLLYSTEHEVQVDYSFEE